MPHTRPIVMILGALALATGCEVSVHNSSATFLRPQRASAALGVPASDAAHELTRLFAARGFRLLEQRVIAPDGELLVKYGVSDLGLSPAARWATRLRDVPQSVYYAWITPATPASSTVSLLGKPTLHGDEPCTPADRDELRCSEVDASADYVNTHMSGLTEAAMVRAVLHDLDAARPSLK